MKLSKKTICISLTNIFVVVCVTVSFGVFVLVPQRKAIRVVDDRIGEIEQKLVSSKASVNYSDIIALNQKLTLAQESLVGYVITPEEAYDLTVDIGKMAKQAGVQGVHCTNRIQGAYGPINECKHICEGRVLIKCKSTFSQFAEFINLLERYKPVMFVDMFQIIRFENSNDGNHQVDIVVTFFVAQDSLTDIADVLNDPELLAAMESAVD